MTRSTAKPRAIEPELRQLRELVAAQHRRLEVVRAQAPALPADDAVIDRFPCRCAKPRLARTDLHRLVEEARLRLELAECSLGRAIAAAWPEHRPEVPVLRPSPGLGAYDLRGVPDLPNAVFALFGLAGAELRHQLDRILPEQHGPQPFLPVFLTNDSDFTPFRDQRLAFEYLPFVCDDAAPPPEPGWAAYLLETLELTLRRWGVRRVIWP